MLVNANDEEQCQPAKKPKRDLLSEALIIEGLERERIQDEKQEKQDKQDKKVTSLSKLTRRMV